MKMLGGYKGYNPNINPTLSNSFVAAAFRLTKLSFLSKYLIFILGILFRAPHPSVDDLVYFLKDYNRKPGQVYTHSYLFIQHYM